jgi:hypothetical protein
MRERVPQPFRGGGRKMAFKRSLTETLLLVARSYDEGFSQTSRRDN